MLYVYPLHSLISSTWCENSMFSRDFGEKKCSSWHTLSFSPYDNQRVLGAGFEIASIAFEWSLAMADLWRQKFKSIADWVIIQFSDQMRTSRKDQRRCQTFICAISDRVATVIETNLSDHAEPWCYWQHSLFHHHRWENPSVSLTVQLTR